MAAINTIFIMLFSFLPDNVSSMKAKQLACQSYLGTMEVAERYPDCTGRSIGGASRGGRRDNPSGQRSSVVRAADS
jgi:hypothetical protein